MAIHSSLWVPALIPVAAQSKIIEESNLAAEMQYLVGHQLVEEGRVVEESK